jgi:hypothetical protein
MRYFEREGNLYKLKRQYVLIAFVLIVLTGLAIIGVFTNLPGVTWVFGIMAVLYFLAIYVRRVEIDMDQKELLVKNGLITPVVRIPFADFLTFELVRTSQYYITTNTSLNLRYAKNGKEKVTGIAQGLTSRQMQNILNEIDEIIGTDGNPGEIQY